MATRKQKEDLVKVLKFTPRDIEISLSGYGGEIVMGRITEAAYDFWQDRDDLSDFVYDWDGDMDVPADARFCTDGAWHDVDDLCHETGCEASDSCWITVTDSLEGQDLFQSNLDLDHLAGQGIDTSDHSHCCPSETEPTGTCVFLGQNFEKGTFFSGSVRITQPFDVSKLSISWTDCDGWRLISGVSYDGEDIEGFDGYSTTGKSMEFRVYRVERDEDGNPIYNEELEDWDPATELAKIGVPVLEGEEEWAQKAIDRNTWNGIPYSPWFGAKKTPVRKGKYEIMEADSSWPFPQFAQWTGRAWQIDGKKIKVREWRGLGQPA